MHALEVIIACNDEAVRKAYQQAVEDRDHVAARRIVAANPDLFTDHYPA